MKLKFSISSALKSTVLALLLMKAVSPAGAQVVITGTNVTHKVLILPQYIPAIENPNQWPIYVNRAFNVAHGDLAPDLVYGGWSNVVITTLFDPKKCMIGAGSPVQGRIGFGMVITPVVAGAKISASMMYALLKGNDLYNVLGGPETVPSYSFECRGIIYGTNGGSDFQIVSGPPTQLVDAIYWPTGTANGFAVNNIGQYNNAISYVAGQQPFTLTCTIYVVDGNGILRAGGGANGQGIAAVSTQSPAPLVPTISRGKVPSSVNIGVTGGIANGVYAVYGRDGIKGSPTNYVGVTTSGGPPLMLSPLMSSGFFRILAN